MLAGGPKEQSRKQIGQRGVIVPVRQQASEKIRAAEDGAVYGRRTPNHDVIAPTCPDVPSIEHKLLSSQARLSGFVVENLYRLNKLGPVGGRLNVDFDHTRVGRHFELVESCIRRGRVTFDYNGQLQFCGCAFNGGDEIDVIL